MEQVPEAGLPGQNFGERLGTSTAVLRGGQLGGLDFRVGVGRLRAAEEPVYAAARCRLTECVGGTERV